MKYLAVLSIEHELASKMCSFEANNNYISCKIQDSVPSGVLQKCFAEDFDHVLNQHDS